MTASVRVQNFKRMDERASRVQSQKSEDFGTEVASRRDRKRGEGRYGRVMRDGVGRSHQSSPSLQNALQRSAAPPYPSRREGVRGLLLGFCAILVRIPRCAWSPWRAGPSAWSRRLKDPAGLFWWLAFGFFGFFWLVFVTRWQRRQAWRPTVVKLRLTTGNDHRLLLTPGLVGPSAACLTFPEPVPGPGTQERAPQGPRGGAQGPTRSLRPPLKNWRLNHCTAEAANLEVVKALFRFN